MQKLGRRKRTDFFQYYDLGKKLGVGSYAEVFEAIDKETQLVYAVKITQLRKDAGNLEYVSNCLIDMTVLLMCPQLRSR